MRAPSCALVAAEAQSTGMGATRIPAPKTQVSHLASTKVSAIAVVRLFLIMRATSPRHYLILAPRLPLQVPAAPVCSRPLDLTSQAVYRRDLLLSLGALCTSYAAAPVFSGRCSDAVVAFESSAQGYSLRLPAAWEQVEKAGADALFKDPGQKGTALGVTVLPVMVPSLQRFGSIDSVGGKLLGAERAKESTLSVTMLSQEERDVGDVLFYDFLYELESTRGRKLTNSTVAIVNSKLYIVNGTVACGKESCSLEALQQMQVLQTAAQSLRVPSSTS